MTPMSFYSTVRKKVARERINTQVTNDLNIHTEQKQHNILTLKFYIEVFAFGSVGVQYHHHIQNGYFSYNWKTNIHKRPSKYVE